MTRPIYHALIAMALAAPIPLVIGLHTTSIAVFVAAISSILPDLDRTNAIPYTTPLTHSITMMVAWSAVGVVFILLVWRPSTEVAAGAIGGLMVGLWGHLLVDHMSGDVIFTVPTTVSIRRMSSPVPVGVDFKPLAGGGLAMSAPWGVVHRVSTGELRWPYWRRAGRQICGSHSTRR